MVQEFKAASIKEINEITSQTEADVNTCGNVTVQGRAKILDVWDNGDNNGSSLNGSVGTYWTKQEFVEKAKAVVHPKTPR